MGIRRRTVLIAVSAVIAAGAVSFYMLQGLDPVRATRPAARFAVPVSVAVAARRDMPIYLSGLGTVQALYTIGTHSQVDGKLIEVLFTEGQHVNKDDILVKIDPRLYQAALDQAKAKKAQDEAQLVATEKDLVRFKTLVAKSFETQQNVDLQQAKVDQIKASLDADAAAIETAQTQLDYTVIRAPTDGRIGVRLVDPGNLVRASDQGSIVMLTRTQPIAVMFTLPAQALDDVRDALARDRVGGDQIFFSGLGLDLVAVELGQGAIFLKRPWRPRMTRLRIQLGSLLDGEGVLVVRRTFAAGRGRSRLFGGHGLMIPRRASTSRQLSPPFNRASDALFC